MLAHLCVCLRWFPALVPACVCLPTTASLCNTLAQPDCACRAYHCKIRVLQCTMIRHNKVLGPTTTSFCNASAWAQLGRHSIMPNLSIQYFLRSMYACSTKHSSQRQPAVHHDSSLCPVDRESPYAPTWPRSTRNRQLFSCRGGLRRATS